MDLLKKRIAAAPWFLLVICAVPTCFFVTGLIFNFNLVSLTLILVGLFVAYIALTGGLASKNLLLVWLVMVALMYFSTAFVYRSVLSEISTIAGPINWLDITNPYPQGMLAVVLMSLIIGAVSLAGVIYLLKSPAIKAFYANR